MLGAFKVWKIATFVQASDVAENFLISLVGASFLTLVALAVTFYAWNLFPFDRKHFGRQLGSQSFTLIAALRVAAPIAFLYELSKVIRLI